MSVSVDRGSWLEAAHSAQASLAALRRRPPEGWLRFALRHRQTLTLVAGVLACVLMFGAFYRTVAQAVHEGDQRRKSLAERSLAEWRCSVMASTQDRKDCRVTPVVAQRQPS